jgi:hypothetical protein
VWYLDAQSTQSKVIRTSLGAKANRFTLSYHWTGLLGVRKGLEPYLLIIHEGFAKGKEGTTSSLKHIYIYIIIAHYFLPLSTRSRRFNSATFKVLNDALCKAPIWCRLDKWLANNLSTPEAVPELRIVFDFGASSPFRLRAGASKPNTVPNAQATKEHRRHSPSEPALVGYLQLKTL